MPRLIWSPSSLDDLKGIDRYLAPLDGAAAGRILRAIRATAERLRDYPRIGRAIEERFHVLGVRTTPYLLIYRIIDTEIEIVRIRHAREDWLGEIEGDL
ncbi:MAG: type II toxin-antitoxin system RelE/ParE family toxin [Pseudomonadota bacterium]